MTEPSIYTPTADRGLRQGEIISDLVEPRVLQYPADRSESPTIEVLSVPFAIVVSQDCDLATDFHNRFESINETKQLPNVLLCRMIPVNQIRHPIGDVTGKIWDRLRKNKDERYQFLEFVGPAYDAAGAGFGPLTVDFKLMFSLPTQFLYDQVSSEPVFRRCRLQSPYLEHFSSRCAYYLSRVGLPRDHEYQENLPARG